MSYYGVIISKWFGKKIGLGFVELNWTVWILKRLRVCFENSKTYGAVLGDL